MQPMTTRERWLAVMNFRPFDRLPIWEWAPWWGETLTRWKSEGLPEDCDPTKYFDLEWFPKDWRSPKGPTAPADEYHGSGIIKTMDDYEKMLPHLYPWPCVGADNARWMADLQAKGEIALGFTVEGFFWSPRALLGIERHLYSFYDQPDLMHRINSDMADYNIRYIDETCKYSIPDYMNFAEDMSYNHGPMLSKETFDEFLAPYYRKVLDRVNEYGILPWVDSDGDVTELSDWLYEVGIRGIFPIERQAGCDIDALRARHPDMRFFGHFDKMVMNQGEAAMRAEFERLLPVASRGGFSPGVDHQTPPGVSLDDYRLYLKLFREYAEEAGRLSQELL